MLYSSFQTLTFAQDMSTSRVVFSFFFVALYLVAAPITIHYLLGVMVFQNILSTIIGVLLIITGIVFITWSNLLFIAYAEGTMSILDQPKKLVTIGPYRYVRNPISIGIITALWGEAVIFGSIYLFGWSMIFAILNHMYLIYMEEPALEEKFGAYFLQYKALVPRWIPLDKAAEFNPKK